MGFSDDMDKVSAVLNCAWKKAQGKKRKHYGKLFFYNLGNVSFAFLHLFI